MENFPVGPTVKVIDDLDGIDFLVKPLIKMY